MVISVIRPADYILLFHSDISNEAQANSVPIQGPVRDFERVVPYYIDKSARGGEVEGLRCPSGKRV